jgi:hypothetical protein
VGVIIEGINSGKLRHPFNEHLITAILYCDKSVTMGWYRWTSYVAGTVGVPASVKGVEDMATVLTPADADKLMYTWSGFTSNGPLILFLFVSFFFQY